MPNYVIHKAEKKYCKALRRKKKSFRFHIYEVKIGWKNEYIVEQ